MNAPDIVIRTLGLADRDAYFALRLRGLLAHPESFGMSYAEAMRAGPTVHHPMLDGSRAAAGDALFGAFATGAAARTLVGIVGMVRQTRERERHKASVVGMYVAPEASGRGIGRALLDTLIAHARGIKGLQQLQLTVAGSNDAARHLYEAAGFCVYGREPRALAIDGALFDADLMALPL